MPEIRRLKKEDAAELFPLRLRALQEHPEAFGASYEDEVKLDKTPNFYVTNRKDWETQRILTTYLDRWPTETFNEDAKGNLGFEDYPLRHLRAIKRHWYLSFVAYSLLGDEVRQATPVGSCAAGSNQPVNGLRPWSMNCWGIWSIGLPVRLRPV